MSDRIRFGEPIEPEVPREELPPRSLLAGGNIEQWREAPFQVYIVQSVYAKIWKHVNEVPTVESGGVLVGHAFKTFDGQITFVVVTAAIPQRSENRSVGHFTVDPVEIRAARVEMEHKYPGLLLVGWYHSHPGHGVFLSGQDMTIVRSIYDASWHIAMVIDPQQRTEGVFVGPAGKQLGGQGNKQVSESWIGLRQVPDGMKAIALYNQAHEQLNEGDPEQAHDLLNRLERLVEHSSELVYWRERGGYRDITEMRDKLSTMPRRERPPEPYTERETGPLRPTLPEPARTRRRQGWSSRYWWLVFSAFLAGVFAVFAFATAVLAENWNYWVTLGWGVLISFLAIVAGGYVVLSREEVETKQSNTQGRIARPIYLAGERIKALFLIGLVLVLWASYGFSQGRLVSSVPETPTNTPMSTSTDTPTPTNTPTLSPTPTDTPTPTFPPTWTPTVTLTTTVPLVNESVTPTLSSVITQTDTITQ
jgi:proteasome lid subunit RPN8/RPN11